MLKAQQRIYHCGTHKTEKFSACERKEFQIGHQTHAQLRQTEYRQAR
jgi:hypothetical protein